MKEKPLFCPSCGTKAEIAAGIGPYCPNKGCPVADNFNNWDEPKEPIKSLPTELDELRKEKEAGRHHHHVLSLPVGERVLNMIECNGRILVAATCGVYEVVNGKAEPIVLCSEEK